MIPPATDREIKEMLETIGLDSVVALFRDIPGEARLKGPLRLSPGLPEALLRRRFSEFAGKNRSPETQISFLGAGVYRHDIPAAIKALISRGEFATAYTPYQAEASQGTLQAIYEFQTLICKLVGMDVANASHYDGATSLAEAALMSMEIAQKNRVFMSRTLHPHYRQVVQTYLHGRNAECQEIGLDDGRTSLKQGADFLSSNTGAAILVQYPNFFGNLEPLEELAALCEKHKALLIVAVIEPVALGLLKPPGERGASIVAGEGQSLGIPPSFGGPHVGYIAAKKEFIRRLPGRLVGQTVDQKGNRAYTLTLQAREQHIRREKAASNVCTNQSLCAVANAIYLSLLGKEGFRELSAQCYHKAHYAFRQWTATGILKPLFGGPFYHEFAVRVSMDTSRFMELMENEGILAGYSLEKDFPEFSNGILLTLTEMNRREEIDRFSTVLQYIEAHK